jgi:hypothetical protein
MKGELVEELIRIEAERQTMPTFPTNKFLLAAAVAGRDKSKKSSGFVGTVRIDWGGRPGYKGPVMKITWSRVQCHYAKWRTELPGE